MKKNIAKYLEILSLILLIFSTVFIVVNIINEIISYTFTQGIPLQTIIFIHVVIYLLVISLIVLVLIYLNKYQKQKNQISLCKSLLTLLMKHKIISIFISVVLLLIISILFIVNTQDLFIFYPNYYDGAEQILIETDKYKKIVIETNGTRLDGWFNYIDDNAYTIIYFGGNAQSSAIFFAEQNSANWDEFGEYNFVMVDYPGYGLSNGIPNEESIFSMSLTVFDYVSNLENINQQKIIVMGFSLGTGVATYVSENREFSKLILISPYTSMLDVFNSKVPIFYGFMENYFNNKFDSFSRINEINEDTLIIYSKSDEVIDYSFSETLGNALIDCQLYSVDNESHNSILYTNEVVVRIKDFITS